MKLVKTEPVTSDLGWIGQDITITGDVVFADRFRVDGTVKGKVVSEKGTLIIGETGRVEAHVEVGECLIQGAITGDLIARSRVEIHRTGKVNGDVITPVLIVEEGAVFNGAVKMDQAASTRKLGDIGPAEVNQEKQRMGA